MRFFTPLFCLAMLATNFLFAEGTREVAPNGVIDVNGNTTTDLAALHINNPSYNSFAAFDNPNPQSRLYIHVKDPAKECLYLGFNWAHNNVTSPNPPRINFTYRIKDPNGNVVYGPITVTPVEANITTWAEGYAGPQQIVGAGGYNATQVTSANLGSKGWTGTGDYYIEFRDDENNDLLIDFWDITVADCSGANPVAKTGRIWSYNWSLFAVNDFGFPNRPFNGAFYVCAPDPDNENASFVTKINFNGSGFRPAAFNVAFNSFGSMNTGNVSEDRKSVQNQNATQAEYSIFLNDPVDICATANVGEISILGVSRCSGSDYCIKLITTKAGQIDLLLDFDGQDNMYTPGTADRIITRTVNKNEVGKPLCIDWDGLDGLGNPMSENVATQIPVTIAYAQGIYHFPIYDAEYMTNGFMISAVRPVAAVSLLFYDDSGITSPSGSGEPPVQLSGCMPPCHRWLNYTQPNTIGFGNLNTINSWWFSQLIIRQDVFFLPSYYSCGIEGPNHFCSGGTSQLTSTPHIFPAGAEGNEIVSTTWSGPGIVGASTGNHITIDAAGVYALEVKWVNNLGDTCSTSCEYEVFVDPPLESSIDTLIVQGQTITINGEIYDAGGTYIQDLNTAAGCDSILTINIIELQTVIHYDLNDCESFMGNGSHMDYSEFVPSYPQPLSCAEIEAGTLHRDNPAVNKHSCTPGVDGSPGMCVGTLAGCTYIPGHEASVVIEVNITPDPDTAVYLTGFSFFEKAPTTFDWISGPSGPNNWPTWFRVRVLKNGTEIFLTPPTATSPVWKEATYDFFKNDEFLVTEPTTFRFELLSYCPVGNGATESVWDLDEINIIASCASPAGLNHIIAGVVNTPSGAHVRGVEMRLYEDLTFTNPQTVETLYNGTYAFESVVPGSDYYLQGYKNDDPLNGVSTLDLIRIQKHLLGKQLFTSPYQYIAADANRSNTITAIDLIEFRKLLLGIYSTLPRNKSWRFGLATQVLEQGAPWTFNETYPIEYLSEDIWNADFIGVKIGDVTGDVKANAGGSQITNRSVGETTLMVRDQYIPAGAVHQVDILAEDFRDVAGLQMQLAFAGGQILDVVGGAMQVSADQYRITPDGQVLISWNEEELLSGEAGQVIFSLIVLPGRAGQTADLLSIAQQSLAAEMYFGDDLEQHTIVLKGAVDQDEWSGEVMLQGDPNPFTQITTLKYNLQSDSDVTLRFYDLSGRLLFATESIGRKGLNTLEVTRDQLGMNEGMVICQLQAGNFVTVQKLMLIRG